MHGIRIERSFEKADIETIRRDVEMLPREPLGASGDQPDTLDDETPDSDIDFEGTEATRTAWGFIELNGDVGFNQYDESEHRAITAGGLRKALQRARSGGLQHVVLKLNTRGGFVYEARQIAEAIREFDDDLVVHTYVERAISAGIWIVFSSDHIWVDTSAIGGAALSFSRNSITGEPLVDAKNNSSISAEVSAIADRKGHASIIARTMIEPERQLWVTDDGALVTQDPFDETAEALDVSAEAVLTLTRRQMVRVGLARELGLLEDIGERLDIEGWAARGADLTPTLIRENRRYVRVDQDACEIYASINDLKALADRALPELGRQAERARKIHPSNYRYGYDRATGEFTPAARQQWQRRTDAAIAAWRAILDSIDDFGDQVRNAEEDFRRANRLLDQQYNHDRHAQLLDQADAVVAHLRRANKNTRPLKAEASRMIRDLETNRHRNAI
jgi:hypothetical protein